MALTADSKKLLAETIRGSQQDPSKGLRGGLLRAIRDEADRQYRLAVPIAEAGLDEEPRRRRGRIEAWIAEHVRATKPKNKTEERAASERFLRQAEKEAAATLINRLVLLRRLEALGLSKPSLLTGGWNSKGYREFREFAPTLCTNGTADASEGYATLLRILFDELAVDLPGLFGDVGLTRLFPIPAATLREVVDRLDDPGLLPAWTDDTTLGWVYQYWNDPDREALDAKISGGGKIAPHEIASKTQMFTERYMVEWLLLNSLGLTWLCMCRKHGWTADAEQVLPVLDARRVEWRARREAGAVALDALMPIEGELEDHWKYYVPQPIPEDAIAKAPDSVRSLKILDPACGSGHFLVIAFELLAALYREEARHRRQRITDREIAESIVENNLHGIDIDPRAIQIAAAGLYLKARSLAKDARPKRVNLVAPVLQLGNLPPDDPAVVHLRQDLKREVGIPEELTTRLLTGLAGVDYLGSLLKVDAAMEEALRSTERDFERNQGDLFGGFKAQQVKLSLGEAKATIVDRLERFLGKHSTSEDLGLRLDGEQLAAGVRFVRMVKEGTYDLVVGNPPYQGLSKTEAFGYVAATYPRGKADLYAAFLERGLELVRPGGVSALLTMRAWMFLTQFAEIRQEFLSKADLRMIGDVDRGAFEEVPDEVVATVMSIIRRAPPSGAAAVAMQPTPLDDHERDGQRTARKRAALLAHVGRHEFDPRGFKVIEGEPVVYWWSREFLAQYASTSKLGTIAVLREGLGTRDDTRFVRCTWELKLSPSVPGETALGIGNWAPFVKGAAGRSWIEPSTFRVRWSFGGMEIALFPKSRYGRGADMYFIPGVAFTTIGASFSARVHAVPGVFGDMGASVFPRASHDLARIVCLLNSEQGRSVLEALNPTVHFRLGDVSRLPVRDIAGSEQVFENLLASFWESERANERAVVFQQPGPSAWTYAQAWAQRAVDRPAGEPLPPYEPIHDPPLPVAFVSHAIGLALGRFPSQTAPLPHGILFLSDLTERLDHPSCAPLLAAWQDHGPSIAPGDDLPTYLRKSFFDVHKKLYDNRPIYFPLSSAKKSFVAFLSIHRWQDDTLSVLLADHLVPAKRRLEGELDDLRTARASGSNKARAEKRFADAQKLLEELNDFLAKVTDLAENGPPPPDDKTPKREVSARFRMDLDDGVMVNSAALWPLLEPQWKDPKRWWKELATASGKKDYDWSHLAARYFPARARAKCHADPSLAVAHGCFWELHPAKACAWELRLQDEIRPEFTIDELGSDAARRSFLAQHAQDAAQIRVTETKRRERKAAKAEDQSDDGPLFDREDQEQEQADG